MDRALQCVIPANPDVTGIGVRVSTYAQAALAVFTAGVICIDHQITERKKRVLDELYRSLLTTFFALLVVSFIQITLKKLSLFHALVALNLSGINALAVFALASVDGFSDTESESTSKRSSTALKYPLYTMASVLVPVLGIYVWATLPSWTSNWTEDCTRLASFNWLGVRISFANRPIRIFTITICAIGVALGISSIIGKCLIASGIITSRGSEEGSKDIFVRLWVVFGGLLMVMVITEQMITQNAAFLQAEEYEWSFSQILAITLLGVPAWVAIKEGWNGWKEWKERRQPGLPVQRQS